MTCLQLLLQGRRLKVAESLAEADVLTRELQAFRSKVRLASTHETVEARRECDHDDLVLVVALACWWAEGHPPVGPDSIGYGGSVVAELFDRLGM